MSYWQDRMADSLARITRKSTRAIEAQLRKYYASAMKRTIADFEATYDKLLASVEDGRQPTPADLYKLDRYWQMQGQLRHELQRLGDKQAVMLSKVFETNFFDVYYSLFKDSATPYTTIDREGARHIINQVWAADAKNWSTRIWENTTKLADTLNDMLVECVVTGAKTTALKKALQERFGVSYRRADTLARTELAHIQTQAAVKRYEDTGIEQLQIWAPKDERRCEVCGKMHMKKILVGEAVPLPAHPNCRCTVVPVID